MERITKYPLLTMNDHQRTSFLAELSRHGQALLARRAAGLAETDPDY